MNHEFIPLNKARTGIESIRTIQVYINRLTHTFLEKGPYDAARQTIREIDEAARKTFRLANGVDFDRWNPAHQEEMLKYMHDDARMNGVLSALALPKSQLSNIQIPWWNEIAAKEADSGRIFRSYHVILEPRHSYQTQAMRAGFEIEGMNAVSVVGLAVSEDNYFVMGLRGGRNYPMTYYYSAGALGLSEELKTGTETIWDFYAKHKLVEYPIEAREITSASLEYRLQLHGGDWDISYVFLFKTGLKFAEIEKRHAERLKDPKRYPDAGEHIRFEPVAIDEKSIVSFVEKYYRGVVDNDKNRRYEDRLLLPQAAGPLLAYASARSKKHADYLPLLDSLAQEGKN